jgi:hypothetical protein
MFNPWFSFSLDTAQLVFKLTRLMAGGTLYPTGSVGVREASPIAGVQAPAAEEQEGPALVAIAKDRHRKSTTRSHVQNKPAQAKARQVPKATAKPKRTAQKRTTPKRAAAASLARPKAIRRSALKRK